MNRAVEGHEHSNRAKNDYMSAREPNYVILYMNLDVMPSFASLFSLRCHLSKHLLSFESLHLYIFAFIMGALLSIPLLTGGLGAVGSSLCSGCMIFMGELALDEKWQYTNILTQCLQVERPHQRSASLATATPR